MAMLVMLSTAAAAAEDAGSAGGVSREYLVKAGLLVKFVQFVEWPKEVFDAESSPLIIAVAGHNPFGNVLEEAARDLSAGPHALRVTYVSPGEIGKCHVLFVPATEDAALPRIFEQAGTSPVLSVGETDAFPWAGGVIRFYVENKKVGFEINTSAAKRARLKISSKLLKLARIFRK